MSAASSTAESSPAWQPPDRSGRFARHPGAALTAQARNILYDASRLVMELVNVLQRYEHLTGDRTNVTSPLLRVFDQLTEHWQELLPSLPGE